MAGKNDKFRPTPPRRIEWMRAHRSGVNGNTRPNQRGPLHGNILEGLIVSW